MNISRWRSQFLTVAIVLWAGVLRAEVLTRQPYRGVTFITRTETSPRNVIMHIVIIHLRAPGIGFKVTPPGGTRDTVRQTTLDFLNQQNAQLAINCHFFLPFPSEDTDANVIGLAASQGTVYSPFEPQPIGPGYVDQSYAILPDAPALNIDRSNRASIVHLDPAFADNKHILEPETLWNAVSGSAQIVSNGVKTIPTYAGPPISLNPIWPYSDDSSWYDYPRARTCIGLTTNRQGLILFTVDEAGGSEGLTVGEAADLLINDYEVYNALNLDGGGSTTMALRDPFSRVGYLVNAPSDSPTGRATGSNLAVFAQRRSNLEISLTLSIRSANCLSISWPASARGWQLQRNPGLNPGDWVDVTPPPHRVSDFMEVNVTAEAASQFYRLIR